MHGGANAPVVRFCASETLSLISNGWVLKFLIRIILNLSSIQRILLFKHLHLPTESLPNLLVVLFPIITALNLVHSNIQYRLKKNQKTSSSIPPICSWTVGKWLNIMFQIFWFFFSLTTNPSTMVLSQRFSVYVCSSDHSMSSFFS